MRRYHGRCDGQSWPRCAYRGWLARTSIDARDSNKDSGNGLRGNKYAQQSTAVNMQLRYIDLVQVTHLSGADVLRRVK